jgi:hypothetical protein
LIARDLENDRSIRESAVSAASSATSPVAEGSIPSGYVWLSGGVIAVGIGYSWGHGTLSNSKDQKEYKFKISGVSVAYLKNDKGVVIKLHSQTGGLRFNLSANGMHVTLQQS